MKILFAAAEGAPFVKVGGLGDVIGSLPEALKKEEIDARVILPRYDTIGDTYKEQMTFVQSISVPLGWRQCHVGIFSLEKEGVIHYFLDNEYFFKRSNVYGEMDDAERFAFFSKAVLEVLQYINFIPDVIHCNDWHTALIPVYLNVFYRGDEKYQHIKTVISIHNIEFQGQYDPYILGNVFGMDENVKELLMYDGCLNILKGGIESADAVTTVSKTYANEIMTPYFSHGLHHILQARGYKVQGIINGIDTNVFNPATDPHIATHYSAETVEDKVNNKLKLQEKLGLEVNPDIPLIAMVTRLTDQKGMDMVQVVMDELAKLPVQFIVLGTGYAQYENMMRHYEHIYHDKVRGVIMFSTSYASEVYAGADLFLMPSKAEPCGLSQMIAMRYGAVPIVHTVGGLKDTVAAYDHTIKWGNGVNFQSYNPWDMFDAIKRSIAIYNDKEDWKHIQYNAMTTDWSWDQSAKAYKDLYNFLMYA